MTVTVTDDNDNEGRDIVKSFSDTLHITEKRQVVDRVEGDVQWVTLSSSSDATYARREEDGTLTLGTEGSPPQQRSGELKTTRLLVRKLNSEGADWGEPSREEEASYTDCLAVHESGSGEELHVQVVQALAREGPWERLKATGAFEQVQLYPVDLATELRETIRTKESIPRNSRNGLVLALDAYRIIGLAMEPVVDAFRDEYGQQVQEVGFESVWVVGTNQEFTRRLDIQE